MGLGYAFLYGFCSFAFLRVIFGSGFMRFMSSTTFDLGCCYITYIRWNDAKLKFLFCVMLCFLWQFSHSFCERIIRNCSLFEADKTS